MQELNYQNSQNYEIFEKQNYEDTKKPELGIYIHIPFCIKKCYYCDFISYPNKFDWQEKYIKKIKEEIQAQKQVLEKYNITTIYIGGGTPSSIESKYIEEILKEIKKYIKQKPLNAKKQEITIEVNPGTVTKEKLESYKKTGVNRISIGLQTTNNKLLKQIGRIHNLEDFEKSYKLIKEAGFENINIDLMIGLPDQTIEDIKKSIEKIINLKPKHISVYSLIIEENTKFEKMLEEKKLNLPSEEEERYQYHYVKNKLELAGYTHYEISNFAINGCESKHNLNCWEQKEYIGFGIAAHSYIDKIRMSNTINLEEYLKISSKEIEEENKKIDKIKKENSIEENKKIELPIKIGIKTINEIQSKLDEEKEYMLLGLRKIQGISISKFKQKFGENPIFLFKEKLSYLANEKLIEIDLDQIKLTRKGLDLANIVWEEFI